MTLPTRAVTVPSPAEQSRQACALPRRALGSRRVLAWEIDPTIQPLRAADTDIPTVVRRTLGTQLGQCQACRQVAFLNQPDDFQLL